MMWAVGDDDGEGWIAVKAESESKARRAYADEWVGADQAIPDRIIAVRVPSWDGLAGKPTGADWIRADLSYRCAGHCGEMAHGPDGAKIINGQPYCSYCCEAGEGSL